MISTKQTISPALRGSLCAVIGGIFWGFSGTCAQYLFSNFHVPPLWLSCTRLFFTAIILTVLALLRHPAACRGIWKDHRHVARLAAYGIFGLMACQSAYIMGISYSNAATTTVLQTLSLVFILLITCARVRRFPTKIETAALLLALFGTFLLATGGKPGQLVSPLPDFSGALPQRGPLYCTVCCRQSSWSAMTGRPSPPSAWCLPP